MTEKIKCGCAACIEVRKMVTPNDKGESYQHYLCTNAKNLVKYETEEYV